LNPVLEVTNSQGLEALAKAWSSSARASALAARRAKAKALIEQRSTEAVAGAIPEPLFPKDDPELVGKGDFMVNRGPDGWQLRKPSASGPLTHVTDMPEVVLKNAGFHWDRAAIERADEAGKPRPRVTLLATGTRVSKRAGAFKDLPGREVGFKPSPADGLHTFFYKDNGQPFTGAEYVVFTNKMMAYGSSH
jgi:hypothetical protein